MTHVKTHVKKFDPRKNIFDQRSPHIDHDPRKIITHVKNIWTYVTHATHVILDPGNPHTHVPTQRKIMTHIKNILTHVTHATHATHVTT